MTKTGFCAHPSPGSHAHCQTLVSTCDCGCHTDPAAFDDGHRIGDVIEEYGETEDPLP